MASFDHFSTVSFAVLLGVTATNLLTFARIVFEKDVRNWKSMLSTFNLLTFTYHVFQILSLAGTIQTYVALGNLKFDVSAQLLFTTSDNFLRIIYYIYVYLRTKAFVQDSKLEKPLKYYVILVVLLQVICEIMIVIALTAKVSPSSVAAFVQFTIAVGAFQALFDVFTLGLTLRELLALRKNINSPNFESYRVVGVYSFLMSLTKLAAFICVEIGNFATRGTYKPTIYFFQRIFDVLTGFLMVDMKRVLIERRLEASRSQNTNHDSKLHSGSQAKPADSLKSTQIDSQAA